MTSKVRPKDLAPRLPVVFIMGPPHSGKSVLAFSLSKALRRKGVLHYLLRAAPDGEGDWFAEGDQAFVRTLRFKGKYTPEFLEEISKQLRAPAVPLLVDPGGRPTSEQEQKIFARATHAVLLLPEQASRAPWERILRKYQIVLLADLVSSLSGEPSLTHGEILRGRLVGLKRGKTAQGEAFNALVEKIADLFSAVGKGLTELHLAKAPSPALNLGQLLRIRHPASQRWEPRDLQFLASLYPRGKPLSLYGRAPNWIYGWGATWAMPAEMHLFDARFGWLPAPILRKTWGRDVNWAEFLFKPGEQWSHVAIKLRQSAVEYQSAIHLTPPPTAAPGVILEGKIPFWLLTALARHYAAEGREIAVYQPNIQAAVVVTGQSMGTPLSVPPLLRREKAR